MVHPLLCCPRSPRLGGALLAGIAISSVLLAAPTVATAQDQPTSMPAASANWEDAWSTIVTTYATRDGGFRYAALRANEAHVALLRQAVVGVGATDLGPLSRRQRLAFLINAYNVLTIDSVLALWPVQSVLAETGFFDARTHRVAGEMMTLNTLENERIRPVFGEPRIHFLVNCASVGCPRLLPELITADNLERRLEAQSREFVRATTRVDAATRTVTLSQIFEWFADDFTAGGGVRAFVAGYLEDEAAAALVRDTSTTLQYTPYDWALNAR